ncbi:MAG: hypothetical protein GTN82_43040 [Candidatus Aminicenantes bacterium]|nr:hypothetical protein [Candidatus Aminicenantes bacterium]NIN23555.1 hypothetical protein [Candidatus Aminicenantes bacterium]NIR12226.1 hypothetical protein [Candidatus Aminicenantes bacterium]
MDIDFRNSSDRDIAERLYKAYGCKLVHYAIKSWQFDEDEAWNMLYDTFYGFIHSYAEQEFASERQVGTLILKIFKNKLRDKLRQNKRREKDYQEESYSGAFLNSSHDSLETVCPQLADTIWEQENKKNPILIELEGLLDDLNDWERQLLICRVNNIPYKVVEEMTGKKKDFLKVHYQRLKERFAKKLEKSLTIKKREEK